MIGLGWLVGEGERERGECGGEGGGEEGREGGGEEGVREWRKGE